MQYITVQYITHVRRKKWQRCVRKLQRYGGSFVSASVRGPMADEDADEKGERYDPELAEACASQRTDRFCRG